ncbi:hypothetical protein LL033_01585 [Clostridium estertheticum]|uniref:hypothetical protein n=1 Tax=Clostridium estertheticum TaxID=238834 RepID=UPI001C0D0539|nr:hypothetical protein [Clostridium estertheticum]MBU3216056.1 hypothetical protein [Clostridium estertheticum]WAG55955.1 hypothetical protein LL033_01585 [Clostridium estertheticum]
MKEKSWLKYFFIILIILFIVFSGQHILDGINKNAQETYNTHPYLQNILMIIFYGGIGLLLGLEHLIHEIKKEGTWIMNVPKFLLMGLPSLYFSLAVFIYYSSNQLVRNISYPIGILITSNQSFIWVFPLILGYSIITSFYKKIDGCK